jgi:E3 ubiquitin-protein ligase UBR2
MDAVVRQINQHIEFEPEWEGAFNLQLKLQDIIFMVLDWAGSDVSCHIVTIYMGLFSE